MTEPDELTGPEADDEEPDTWVIVAIDYDRRGVAWMLWAFGRDRSAGRVEANEAEFFLGEFGRAASLWQAFAGR